MMLNRNGVEVFVHDLVVIVDYPVLFNDNIWEICLFCDWGRTIEIAAKNVKSKQIEFFPLLDIEKKIK